MATKRAALHIAKCIGCGASCRAGNAQAWAHHHADRHGHRVELKLGWEVVPVEGKAA